MVDCKLLIKNGLILRYIITIITYYLLYINISIIIKYLYLILPICLTILDGLDNIFTSFVNFNGRYNGCLFEYYYQINDKICDSISYLLLFLFFKLDYILLFFILYRILGVILFYLTKNSIWLIIFFDFAKEYLLYLFIFGKNYKYILYFIICKIIFEYYFHTIINTNNYK